MTRKAPTARWTRSPNPRWGAAYSLSGSWPFSRFFLPGPVLAGGPLRAAAGVTDGTPPETTPLAGFGSGDCRIFPPDFRLDNFFTYFKPYEEVHDRLWIKALALADDEDTVLLVKLDTVAVPASMVEKVAGRLESLGVDLDHLMIYATHNHSGPGAMSEKQLWWFVAADKYDERLAEIFVDRIAELGQRLLSQLEPARVGVGVGQDETIGRNRRDNPGVFDPDMTVLRLERLSGESLAVLFNFSVHPTVLGSSNLKVTADFVGYAEAWIEAQVPGAVAIFMNGAEGDVAPARDGRGGFEAAAWVGEKLGRRALEILDGIASLEDEVEIQVASKVFEMPDPFIRCVPDGDDFEWCKWIPWDPKVKLPPESLETQARFQAIRLGQVVFASVPGEPLTEIGFAIKDAAREMGFDTPAVAGLANGYISYITTEDEYWKGGYESLATMYGPQTGELVVQHATEVLRLVAPATPGVLTR